MTRRLRVIDTGVQPAAWNVAASAALSRLHGQGAITDTLRLHRYRPCVLAGASQPFGKAADLEACRAHGVALVRRVTGGGAVYMAPGVLAWDLALPRAAFPSLDAAAEAICMAVIDCLAGLGLAATFSAPGSVRIGAFKVSGSAGRFDGPSLLHQGTLVVDADFEEMAAVLGIAEADLPVTSLAAAIGAAPPVDTVAGLLADAMAARLCLVAEPGVPGPEEWAAVEEESAEIEQHPLGPDLPGMGAGRDAGSGR